MLTVASAVEKTGKTDFASSRSLYVVRRLSISHDNQVAEF